PEAVLGLCYGTGLEVEDSRWHPEDNLHCENSGSTKPNYCGERCKRLAEERQHLEAELRRAQEYEKALDQSLKEEASFREYLNAESRRRIEMNNEISRALEEENKILVARIRAYLPSYEMTDLTADMPITSESDAAGSE
ncbi:hypothetical protein OSTOST_18335, partial [Ostertagia ostertagi]